MAGSPSTGSPGSSTASRARSTRCTAARRDSATGCGRSAATTIPRSNSPSKSPDGNSGFPGALTATCVYRLLEPATLRVELSAVSDRPTIVNLTQHSYFNLDGSPDILDHEVTLFADFYTPTNSELIPTGEIRAVAGTAYDFRQPRPVRDPTGTTYDTNFVAALELGEDGLAQIASVRSPRNGLTLNLFSTEPGVQFYDAAKLNVPVPGLGSTLRRPRGLVPRARPSQFAQPAPFSPSCVLTPEDEYRHESEFRFA